MILRLLLSMIQGDHYPRQTGNNRDESGSSTQISAIEVWLGTPGQQRLEESSYTS